MRQSTRNTLAGLLVCSVSVLLAACGGGNNNKDSSDKHGRATAKGVLDGDPAAFSSKDALVRQERLYTGDYQLLSPSGRQVELNLNLNDSNDLRYSYKLGLLSRDGQAGRETGLRYSYALNDQAKLSAAAMLRRDLVIGAFKNKEGEVDIAAGLASNADIATDTAGSYRVLARACDAQACKGVDMRVTIANNAISSSEGGDATLPMLAKGVQLVRKAHSNSNYELRNADSSSVLGSLQLLPLANSSKALVLTSFNGGAAAGADDGSEAKKSAFAIATNEPQPYKILREGNWRGWDTKGAPQTTAYQKGSGNAGTANVKFSGPTTADTRSMFSYPLSVVMNPADGYMFVGMQRLIRIKQ